jgi:dihydropyrimidinase
MTRKGPMEADLVVSDDKIVALAPRGRLENGDIDATGLWVLPGAVDAHTHFGMPLGNGLRSLGWKESSTAALLGGTTCVVDFANPGKGESLSATVARWRAMADDTILCDYGLHCTVTDTSPDRLAEIPDLIASGIPSIKGFLAYKGRLMLSPGQLQDLMMVVRDAGGILLVHAEDGEMNAQAEQVLKDLGRIGPVYHPQAHPAVSEEKAVAEALQQAVTTGCPLEIVHISLARSAELLTEARTNHPQRADTLWGEVCIQHLFADDNLYQGGHESALGSICSPPLRPAGNGDQLLEMLADGKLDILSTDHCEFTLNEKAAAAGGGFYNVPNGCGGVGERLVISHTQAVVTGKLSPARWVDTIATRPAELMGLGTRKGQLEPGFDADIVLFDPKPEYRWEPLGQSDRAGSLWAGMPVQGAVRDVWLRGKQVVSKGQLVSVQPGGVFLPRKLNDNKG